MRQLQSVSEIAKNDFHNNIREGQEKAKQYSWEKMGKETLRLYNSLQLK